MTTVASADTLAEAMRLLPADTVGAIVVPDLKRANDELALCMERMDRPEAFFVGRPIDLAKAQFGLSVGVRDQGSLVAALRWPDGADAPLPVLIVPVSDAPAFIDGNFVRNQAGTLTSERLDGMHALDLGRWVALSPDPAAIEDLHVAEGDAALERLHARLGQRATRLLRGEVLAWVDGAALRRLAADGVANPVMELFEAVPLPMPVDAAPASTGAEEALAGLDLVAMSLDLDALGVMAHGAIRYETTVGWGSLLRRPERPHASLGRLPDATPYWAISVDLAALRPFLLAALPGEAGNESTRNLLASITALEWGCWPSRLGVAVGGLLNDSSLLVRTGDPEALRDGVLDFIAATAGERDGLRVEPQIERDRPFRAGGSADAFEIRETPLPDAEPTVLAIRNTVRSLLFGNRGVHGLVRGVPDGVVITFSQRPDVLNRATDAGLGAPALADSPVVGAMRDFMVDRPAVEAYLGISELARVARQLAGTFGFGDLVPAIEAGSEPVGVALSVDDGTLLGSVVVPAGVLGAALDQARRMR